MQSFSKEQVSSHNSEMDCWVIIAGGVYDVTPFLNEHPGGKKILLKVGGMDATNQFNVWLFTNISSHFMDA